MPALRGLQPHPLSTAGFFSPQQLSGAISVDHLDRSRITELALAQLAASSAPPPSTAALAHTMLAAVEPGCRRMFAGQTSEQLTDLLHSSRK